MEYNWENIEKAPVNVPIIVYSNGFSISYKDENNFIKCVISKRIITATTQYTYWTHIPDKNADWKKFVNKYKPNDEFYFYKDNKEIVRYCILDKINYKNRIVYDFFSKSNIRVDDIEYYVELPEYPNERVLKIKSILDNV